MKLKITIRKGKHRADEWSMRWHGKELLASVKFHFERSESINRRYKIFVSDFQTKRLVKIWVIRNDIINTEYRITDTGNHIILENPF